MIEKGDKAPRFTLTGHDGNRYGPRSFGRKRVALALFPEQVDEVTHKFLMGLRGGLGSFFSASMVPVGVCPASPEALSELRSRLELPFILLSDPEGILAREYGVSSNPQSLKPAVIVMAEDTSLLQVITDPDPEDPVSSVIAAVSP